MSPARDPGQLVDVGGRQVRLTSLDKVLWPATASSPATTKADLLQYLAAVAVPLLDQLADRPVTRVRWPHGVGPDPERAQRFFEKNAPPGAPSWLRTVAVSGTGRRSLSAAPGEELVTYPLLDDVAGLVWAGNASALELHTPQWTVGPRGAVRSPDRLVIDLDPGPGTGLDECAELAHLVAERLGDDGLECVPVTSGSKGLQLYAPVSGRQEADVVHGYVQRLAQSLARDHAGVTAVMTRAVRTGKVLLDWSQNSPAKTTITPYSPRGRARPTVAAPREWSELRSGLQQLTMAQVSDRVERLGDLMAQVSTPGPRLPA